MRVIELSDGKGKEPGSLFKVHLTLGDVCTASLAGLLAFLVYLFTVAPTVTSEDSGELIAASFSLGIPHPPGYPLYVILGKIFLTLFPFGEVAYRMNLFSALLGSAAVGMVVLLTLRLSAGRLVSAAAGLLAGFSAIFWSQATIAEVYTLTAVVFLGILHIVILYLLNPSPARLCALAYLSGLSLTAHPGMVLILPGILLAILFRDPGLLRRFGELLAGASFALLGFSIYLYLPIRSLADPVMDWGDPETLAGFFGHLLRLQYSGQTVSPENPFRDRLFYLGHLALFEVSPIVLVLSALGIRALFSFPGEGDWARERLKTRRAFKVFYLALVLLLSVGFLFFISVSFQKQTVFLNQVFFIPLLLLLVPPVALGLSRVSQWLGASIPGVWGSRMRLSAVAVIPAGYLLFNFDDQDKSRYTIARDYAECVLKTLPKDSVYISGSDHSNFPILYLQVVEGQRPDIILADKYGYLDPSLLRRICKSETELREVRSLPRLEADRWLIDRVGRPVFVSSKRSILEIPPDRFLPVGILYRVDRERQDLSQPEEEKLWGSYSFGNLTEDFTWFGQGRDVGADFIASEILFLRAEYHFKHKEDALAKVKLRKILETSGNYKEVVQNTGSFLAEKGHVRDAMEFYERALALDPDYKQCRRNYAWALLYGKVELKKAIALAEKSLEEMEPNAPFLRSLGDAYRWEKRYQNALDAYLAASRLDHSDWQSLRLAGEVLESDLKQLKLARVHFEGSLKRKPTQLDLIEKLHGKEARERYEEAAQRALDELVEGDLPQVPKGLHGLKVENNQDPSSF